MASKAPIATALIAIAASASILFWPESIKFCEPNGTCLTLSRSEYTDLKTTLREKVARGEKLTWEEYGAYVKIVDYEIKRRGGVRIKDVKTREDISKAINNLLTE